MYDMRCLHSALRLGLYTRVDSEPYLTSLGESVTEERQQMSEQSARVLTREMMADILQQDFEVQFTECQREVEPQRVDKFSQGDLDPSSQHKGVDTEHLCVLVGE